jgi:predicted amidohydrolase
MPARAPQLSARRPELYGDLTLPTPTLPVHAILQEPLVPAKSILRVAVAQYPPFDSTQAMGEVVRPLTAQLARESADLVVLPDLAHGLTEEAAWRGDLVFPFYRSLSKQSGVAILATAWEQEGSKRYKTARLFHNGLELGAWRQTHFAPSDEAGWTPGDEIGTVVKLPGGSSAHVGVMLGADGYHPEVARILMLRGADIILWPTRPNLPGNAGITLTAVARSRAAENRVGLAVATPMEFSSGLDLYRGTRHGSSMVLDSYGAVVAPCLPKQAMTASAQLSVSASREKTRAPGTDVVYSRLPHCYARLTVAD